ncbi:unnamed protein product [Musa hybrid cultivar]
MWVTTVCYISPTSSTVDLLHLCTNYRVQSSITVNGLKNIIMGVSLHIFLIIKYFVLISSTYLT